MAVEKNFRVTISFYKKHCLPVVTWNKNNLSKQIVPIKHTLKKRFFAVVILLKVCESFLFRQSEKLVVYFGLYGSSLVSQRSEGQINTVYEK